MRKLRPFSEATKDELRRLVSKLHSAAVKWSEEYGFNGLSAGDGKRYWNLYVALDKAVHHGAYIDPDTGRPWYDDDYRL